MADIDGDEGFLDDDLDALISQDFLELQQRALHSTQQQKPALPSYGLQDSSHARPVISARRSPRRISNSNSRTQAKVYPENLSSDYGDLDDEVLDAGLLDIPRGPHEVISKTSIGPRPLGESTQREQWRHQRFSGPATLPEANRNQWASKDQESNAILGGSRTVVTEEVRLDDEEEMLDVSGQIDEPVTGKESNSVDELQAKVAEVPESVSRKYCCLCLQAYLVATRARES